MDFHKNKLKTEFRVGLFTIVGILILVLSYAWFTEYISNKNYQEIKVEFSNAGNIEKGSDVTILGVKRGRVNNIEIGKGSVILTLKVILDNPLYEKTNFIINEVDLMGDVQIEIEPGKSNVPLDLELVQQGEVQYGMSKMISEMGEVVIGLKLVLSELVKEDGMLNNTRSIIDTSLNFVTDLKNSFHRNSANFDKMIDKSAEVSAQLSKIIADNEENLNKGFSSIVEITEDLKATLEEFRLTSESFRTLSDKVSTEKSTVNRLLSEDDLYISLERSITRMDSLLQDIEENPKRYFKFSIF